MDESSEDTTRRPRHKDKAKKGKDSKERKLARLKKPQRQTLTEEGGRATHSGEKEERGKQDDVERGLTQEAILQFRALDMDDDDNIGHGSSMRRHFVGYDQLEDSGESSTTWYAENEVSGEFFRVRRRHDRNHNVLSRSKTSLRRLRRRRHRNHDIGSDDEEERLMTSGLFTDRLLHEVEAALGMLGHGIVVGLSWMDAFNLGAARDKFLQNESTRMRFVCTYSGMADRSRQLFFLLFNLMRKISRLRAQPQVADEDQRLRRFRVHSLRLLQGAFVCMALVLLVLLIASPSALRLATAFAQDPNWCEQVKGRPTSTSSALSRLQQSTVVNAVLLSLGWLLVCIQCNLGMSSHLLLRRRLVDAHAAMDQLELRADHVDGKTLDGLSIETLKELIQQHHRAVEATESVLVTKLQMQNTTGPY